MTPIANSHRNELSETSPPPLPLLPPASLLPREVAEERFSFGFPALDEALKGGLSRSACHEFYAFEADNAASACGMALALASRAGANRPLLWVRQDEAHRRSGAFYPSGMLEFGLDPGLVTLVKAKNALFALQAGLEGARTKGLGASIIELHGAASVLDLTASRKLALAAKATGVPVLLVRVATEPVPSAAESRWQVRAAPSRRLPPGMPGHPAFALTLLRHRNGFAGRDWLVEWNRDRHCFEDRSHPLPTTAALKPTLSRPVVSVLSRRTPEGNDRERRSG